MLKKEAILNIEDNLRDEKLFIPFSPPDITDIEIEEVINTLKSGWITTGPKSKEFERELSAYCGTNKSVATNSATAAMEMTLRLLGIGKGDEVITTAYTYTASASVIHHVGADIVMVDSGKDSFHIDYDQIADAITEKTKAIIAVDIAGVVCDYQRIFDIVEEKKSIFQPNHSLQENLGRIAVISDAAHSFGATYKDKVSGSLADFTCFSFHAVKNLTTGEGGAVTWREINGVSDEKIYQHYMHLILHGQSKDALAKSELGSWEYDILMPGYKCNMTDVMASIGLGQLKRYEDLLTYRRRVVELYEHGLEGLPVTYLKHYTDISNSSGHLFLVRLTGKEETYRNEFIKKMAERGITTNVHYKPLPMFTAYKNLGFDIQDYPQAFEMYENEITLPLHTQLTEKEINYILKNFREILSELD